MYNLNFIRLFNPHLKNINQYQLLNILKNINPEIKSKYNLILDINGFKKKYPEFDLQYYLIFNDDLLINLQSEVSVYLHYIKHGKNEERITNKNSFLKEYKYYDYDFFYNINQKFIDKIFYEKLDIINKYTNFGIDINSKTFREIYISKIYSIEYEINIKEKYNNKDCILNITDFNFKYPNIKIHFIAIFNEEYFPEFNKNTKITKELSYKIIKFYLDNKNKNINKVNLIFDEDDFYKKYPYFDIDIYKYFNKISDKEKNIYYLVDYHSNFSKGKILISCKEDFYEKYKTFDLLSFKKFNSDYEKKEELKCLYDYHINYDTETKLLGSKEDFYNKYPDFDITIFKKFNSEYVNKSELECLYDYHNYRNNENTILISNLDEFYSKYPTFTKDKDENISGEEKILKCLQFLKEENEFREQIKEYNFDWEFYLDYYQDIKSGIEINEKEAFNHYLNYGKEEGRICSKNELKNNLVINLTDDDIKEQIKKYNFDWEFYLDYYQDIKNDIENTEKEAFIHYISYGKEEGRICNQETLDEDNNNINNNNDYNNDNIIDDEINKIESKNVKSKNINEIPEFLINILIILDGNTLIINEKLEYILGMNYRNYRILIGSSNQDDINNIKIKDNRIETYLIQNNIIKNLKFKVDSGFILLINLTEIINEKYILKILNSHIENDNDLVIINSFDTIESNISGVLFHNQYNYINELNNEFEDIIIDINFINKYNFNKKNITLKGYEIIKEVKDNDYLNNKYWCHLHCYDIDKFDEIYGEYIDNIVKYFSVIVTFSRGNIIVNKKITLLKTDNKGIDIGAKILFLKYLYLNNINFTNILFLHSKSNIKTRIEYFNPFIKNIKQINYIISIINQYDLIIPDKVHNGDWNMNKGYTINKYYYEWYNNIMNFKHLTNLNIEGNCLICCKKILLSMFPLDKIDFFYSKLNTKNSFDYNWVKHQYKLFNYTYDEIYEKFINEKLLPNHLSYNGQKLIKKYEFIFNNEEVNLDENFLKDGSIEHLYERLWLNVCKNLNGTYKVIKEENIISNIKLPYQFNTNLYKFLNNEQDECNSIETIYKFKKKIQTSKNIIYSLKQILEKLPLNFDINKYSYDNNLFNKNKYEIINHYLFNNKNDKSKKWIDIQNKFNITKTFVYIFPQFHNINENNKFWGEGFTDWNNVKKTKQIHSKHMPIHPHEDISYYNILDIETRKRWNNYAEEYGFYGYIYCHFWFSHGIVMNKPLDKILEDGEPNNPWFLNWINENWTKRWDGGKNEILLDVNINDDLCNKHFNVLLKYFKHKNYYKIDNKPCLGVYRAEEIKQSYINKLIKLSKQNGFDGLVFFKTLNNKLENNFEINNDNYCEYEFEYPPNYSGTLGNTKFYNKNFNFYIDDKFSNNYDINKHYLYLTKTKKSNKKLVRGIMPCWDNYPRHNSNKSNHYIQIGSNSLLFYLTIVKQFLLIKKEKGEYYFINSLNEWGEQCVLEPSIQDEYSYLEAFKLAKQTDLEQINENLLDDLISYNQYSNNLIYLFNKYKFNIRKPNQEIKYKIIKQKNFNSKLICHIHSYDINKFKEIFQDYIDNLIKYFSVIVTYSIGNNIYNYDYDITILKIPNKGVDIGAKICCIKYLSDYNIDYDNILFLHSKSDIKKRLEYFNPLIKNENIIKKNIELLNKYDALFNNLHTENLEKEYVSNRYYHKDILNFLDIDIKDELPYSEGNCMFLSKQIIEFLFTNNLHIFYNILNTKEDFDISWVKGRYNKHNLSNEELYKDFKNDKNYMNLNGKGKAVGNNFGNLSNDMPDGMIEHIFERIYVNVIKHLKLKYVVVS